MLVFLDHVLVLVVVYAVAFVVDAPVVVALVVDATVPG